MSRVHKVNCGYARVAIWQLSEVGKGKQHNKMNYDGRNEKFQALFEPLTTYGIDSAIFEGYGHRECTFNRYCKSINGLFQKWKVREAKQSHIRTFSTENWKKLSVISKRRHSISNCKECAIAHKSLQEGVPGPVFNPCKALGENVQSLIHQNAPPATTTRQILAELQPTFKRAYGFTFTESLANCQGSGVQLRLTDAQRKAQKRKIQRECRDSITEQLHKSDALTVLSEGQSLQSHKRMRMSQSFETPEQTRKRASSSRQCKPRKHSPKFDNVQWDKEGLLDKLKDWPEGIIINWSEIAREFNIPGSNGGQIVKEFASENDISVLDLDKRPPNTRIRARKLRMPGGEVSVPTHRTEKGVKDDWQKMIESGEFTLGEPCYPHKLIRYTVHNGELKQTETTVYGRKIPLLELRQKLLEKHLPLMYLHTDEQLLALNKSELMDVYAKRKLRLPSEISEDALREKLKEYERTRTIGMWHDHSSILGHGYVLVTMKIFYDPAVFKEDEEVKTLTRVKNVQAYVEEPEIHILAMSSSSNEDQAALLEDRLACIKQMNTELLTKENIAIRDQLIFFNADKPAAQFERGTQQGGNYPCGSCGVHALRMDDFAHSSSLKWRSLDDLQTLVLKGKHTKLHAHHKHN